jgi:hypothetical protein
MAKIDKNLTKLQKLALTINPLKNLTNSDIENLLQQSKLGNDVRLQYAYEEMEKVTPIFGICIERRISEILNRGWNIVPLTDGDESLETTTQKETLERLLKKSDLKSGTGLTDAIRHLALYAFRGRSIVKPFIENGELEFTLLSNTNVVKDVYDKYYWIEDGNVFFSSDDISKHTQIPEKEIIAISTKNAIDYPGLLVYLRQAIGELQWARFIEKQGIPQVVITAPEGTTEGQFSQFTQRAQAIYEGGSGTLPYGTNLNVLDSSRGQDPFSTFLKHQEEIIAILSLGSTAAVLPQSSGLGSDLNSTQQKILNNLISQDCRLIQNAISNYFYSKGFTNVRFEFNGLKHYEIDQLISLAKSLTDLGLVIDKKKLVKELDLDIFVEDEIKSETWSPGNEK